MGGRRGPLLLAAGGPGAGQPASAPLGLERSRAGRRVTTRQQSRELLGAVRSYRAANGWRILADFAELLALDNQTQDLPSLRRNATAIAAMFAARGATTEVIEEDGAAPLVVGHLGAGPERPTLGVYVHYDGQPTGSGWHTPPFDPVLRAASGETVPFPSACAPTPG